MRDSRCAMSSMAIERFFELASGRCAVRSTLVFPANGGTGASGPAGGDSPEEDSDTSLSGFVVSDGELCEAELSDTCTSLGDGSRNDAEQSDCGRKTTASHGMCNKPPLFPAGHKRKRPVVLSSEDDEGSLDDAPTRRKRQRPLLRQGRRSTTQASTDSDFPPVARSCAAYTAGGDCGANTGQLVASVCALATEVAKLAAVAERALLRLTEKIEGSNGSAAKAGDDSREALGHTM